MSKTQPTATSLSKFIEFVSEFEKKWSSKDGALGLWYRGQQKAYWSLIPKLYRDTDPEREMEDEIREEFIVRAPSLTEEKPQNSWEWYFLMQHFRAPTRLLDWTDGALLALYFAVRDNPGYYDSAVWVLDPWWMNKRVIGKWEVIPPGATGLSKEDESRYRPWLPERFDTKARLTRQYPVAVYPTHITRRISTQRSCFTIHGSDREGLEKLRTEKGARLAKIVVPSFEVRSIREQLVTCGIDEVTVFPDLEGLGRAVSVSWQSDKKNKPHDEVYTRLRPSKIRKGGVGVFAIRQIKKGTSLFSGDNDEMLWVEEKSLPKRPRQIRKLYDFAVVKDGRYGCPPTFNRLTVAWYLNHSKKPNVKWVDDYDFVALKDIKPGDELTVDYSTYNDPPALNFE